MIHMAPSFPSIFIVTKLLLYIVNSHFITAQLIPICVARRRCDGTCSRRLLWRGSATSPILTFKWGIRMKTAFTGNEITPL